MERRPRPARLPDSPQGTPRRSGAGPLQDTIKERKMSYRKHTLTLAIAALAGSLSLGAQAQPAYEPQGLYSAETILDADVYLSSDPDEPVGEVEDILFDEAMQVTALVVESGSVLGLGGREFIVRSEEHTSELSHVRNSYAVL